MKDQGVFFRKWIVFTVVVSESIRMASCIFPRDYFQMIGNVRWDVAFEDGRVSFDHKGIVDLSLIVLIHNWNSGYLPSKLNTWPMTEYRGRWRRKEKLQLLPEITVVFLASGGSEYFSVAYLPRDNLDEVGYKTGNEAFQHRRVTPQNIFVDDSSVVGLVYNLFYNLDQNMKCKIH